MENYELRNLTADDIFPMLNIISKIGVKEFKNCFSSLEAKKAISNAVAGKQDGDSDQTALIGVAFDAASIVAANAPKCKDDIYQLLSNLTGKEKREIAKLPMADFFGLIIAVFKKEEFSDFFKGVSRLLK